METEGSLPHSQVPTTFLSQLDPDHTTTSHFLKTHLIIIVPSTPGSPQWPLSLRFPHQNPVYTSPLPHTCYAPPISFFSILSPEQYWVSNTDHRFALGDPKITSYLKKLPEHIQAWNQYRKMKQQRNFPVNHTQVLKWKVSV